eukprot:scaffold121861_cov72-Phaeocystis_antarctica.AAC.5
MTLAIRGRMNCTIQPRAVMQAAHDCRRVPGEADYRQRVTAHSRQHGEVSSGIVCNCVPIQASGVVHGAQKKRALFHGSPADHESGHDDEHTPSPVRTEAPHEPGRGLISLWTRAATRPKRMGHAQTTSRRPLGSRRFV